jgi:hypothetical protein
MMPVSRPEVLRNLIRFKDNLLEMRGEEERRYKEHDQDERKKKGERTYKVLINRKTGDMRFAQKISSIELSRKGKATTEDWKEAHLIVHTKDKLHFEMEGLSDLEPLSQRIANETVDILNEKANEMTSLPAEMLEEEAVLLDLSGIQVGSPREQIQDMPGWMGSIGRIDAEKMLQNRPVGTYLLREGDEITISTAFHFEEQIHMNIHPYLLTVVETEEKIVDIILFKTAKGWTFYHDDPNLKDPIYHYFPNAKALISSIGSIAKRPLE